MAPPIPPTPPWAGLPRHRSSAMPLSREAIAAWLGAGLVIAVLHLTLVLGGGSLPAATQSLFLVGLCATLAAGGLVSARSNRALQASLRDERARPAAEELVGPSPGTRSTSYISGMERWTAAMLELIDHAMSATDSGAASHLELEVAAAETGDLRDLLTVEAPEELTINDLAQLHALGSLWEASQPSVEQLAAQADPAWHRRWRARSVVECRLRHGQDLYRPIALPYSS